MQQFKMHIHFQPLLLATFQMQEQGESKKEKAFRNIWGRKATRKITDRSAVQFFVRGTRSV